MILDRLEPSLIALDSFIAFTAPDVAARALRRGLIPGQSPVVPGGRAESYALSMPSRRLLASAAALALLSPAWVLSACSPVSPPAAEEEQSVGGDAWVVVMFEDREDEFDVNLMDELLETELAADQALAEANAGWIDGNDVGAHGYELYFIGDNAEAMWRALEPVFASAPVAWTRVELRNGLEDASPKVLLQD